MWRPRACNTCVLSLRYITSFLPSTVDFPKITCFAMYLSLFKDARGVLITCCLCRISLPLTSFSAMDFTAKLTGQLDFAHDG